MCEKNCQLISMIVHTLIKIADEELHCNDCKNKDNCEAIKRSREDLYELREKILDLWEKEK